MTNRDIRVMRIPLPIRLIRQMDEVILEGIGGYATRAEFIVDAVQERILELTVREDDQADALRAELMPELRPNDDRGLSPALATSTQPQLDQLLAKTTITAPARGFVMNKSRSRASPQPLFGMHNRDYPSIWSLARLAAVAGEHPLSIVEFYERVVHDAWAFGGVLADLESKSGLKATALFPTNPEKRKAAEAAFLVFAVGDYRTEKDGRFITNGPLFDWGVAAVDSIRDGLHIGVTAAGWDLLEGIDGITVEEPHALAAARHFFHHLAVYAEADWAAFTTILSCVDRGESTRKELLGQVSQAWPEWTENEVSTNSAGYVARAREWGLLERKQVNNRYQLASLGHELLAGNNAVGRK